MDKEWFKNRKDLKFLAFVKDAHTKELKDRLKQLQSSKNGYGWKAVVIERELSRR